MGRCSCPLSARLGRWDPESRTAACSDSTGRPHVRNLGRYLPLATAPGHPYLVTHDNYGRTFWFSRSNISPAPVKLPLPLRYVSPSSQKLGTMAHGSGRWCGPSLKSSEVRTRQASGSTLGGCALSRE